MTFLVVRSRRRWTSSVGITVGAASKLVDRLERAGFASRSPNPDNRRSSLVALTTEGQWALAVASQVCSSALARLLGDEDVETLIAALQRLQRRVDVGPVGTAA